MSKVDDTKRVGSPDVTYVTLDVIALAGIRCVVLEGDQARPCKAGPAFPGTGG